MGRPKQFNREGVLDRAIPVFWKQGFANTTVQDLEQATGVNKSGLYTEFKDKEDLFLASLERYAQTRGAEILTAQPLGWGNIERFLRLGFGCDDDQRGCFAVNSMRELAGLPAEAQEIISSGVTSKPANGPSLWTNLFYPTGWPVGKSSLKISTAFCKT